MTPLTKFNRLSVANELDTISQWWQTHTIDNMNGGFVGEIDFWGKQVENANKGIILNSRILWFFSELAMYYGSSDKGTQALATAARSYQYILDYFDDPQFGGAVWELSATGATLEGKKQTYAQCFCIYAFTAYFNVTQNKDVLNKANDYFDLVESYAKDKELGGYIEAFSQNWQVIDDFRLSDKDLNVPKSMNTHLHVLEAYAALYKVQPTAKTEAALRYVLSVFDQHIIDHSNNHLKLFFDFNWDDQSCTLSYGHDIEASWLIWEAVECLGDPILIAKWHPLIVGMAKACMTESIGSKGQLCEEFDKVTQHKNEASYWWVQAEALVGFLNAYHLTKELGYEQVCHGIWRFIETYHKDLVNGEWHWLSTNDNNIAELHYKVGFWKAPYHNGRAMLEVIKLFDKFGE